MVAAAAQRLGEADRELALAAEAGDRLAQLLHAGETGIVVADLDIEADHARIVGRLPQQLDGLGDVARVAPQAAAQQAGRTCVSDGTLRRSSDSTIGVGQRLGARAARRRRRRPMPAIASRVRMPMVASRPTMNRRMASLRQL